MTTLIERAVKYLSIRPHSEEEVFLYLSRKTEDKEEIKNTITKLKENDLLDDKAFAKSWSVFRLKNHNPKGPHIIRQELFQKGVAKEIVEELMSSDEIKEMEKEARVVALDRLSKKYTEPEKIKQMLYARGF